MAAAQKVDGLGLAGLVDDEFVGWWILQPAHGPDQPNDPGVADLGYRLLQRLRWSLSRTSVLRFRARRLGTDGEPKNGGLLLLHH